MHRIAPQGRPPVMPFQCPAKRFPALKREPEPRWNFTPGTCSFISIRASLSSETIVGIYSVVAVKWEWRTPGRYSRRPCGQTDGPLDDLGHLHRGVSRMSPLPSRHGYRHRQPTTRRDGGEHQLPLLDDGRTGDNKERNRQTSIGGRHQRHRSRPHGYIVEGGKGDFLSCSRRVTQGLHVDVDRMDDVANEIGAPVADGQAGRSTAQPAAIQCDAGPIRGSRYRTDNKNGEESPRVRHGGCSLLK